MNETLLWTVVEETQTARAQSAARLDRFLACTSAWQALAIWLDLKPGERIPDRERIAHRICVDIAWIDQLLCEQVNAVLHHPGFQTLEASWRGLHHLTAQVSDDDHVKIRVLDISWKELTRDLTRVMEFDQSQLFRKVYSEEFGMPGGEPYGVLLGDYYVHHRPSPSHPFDDVGTLRLISQVAAAAFSPFIAGAHPALLGLDGFADLERPVDVARVFQQAEYLKWNALREEEDVRFVGLTMPRILMRLPYADQPVRVDGFRFTEDASAPDRSGYVWGNAIYAFGSILIRSFAESGWLASIRGVERDVEGGGLVTSLPIDSFNTDVEGLVPKGSTEVMITDVLEKELEDLGFIALCHAHGTHLAAFYGSQSIQKAASYDKPVATVNAKLSSMLQYMLCVSRFAHYLKVIGRDKIGSFTNAADCQNHLNNWLIDYSTNKEDLSTEEQAVYPLSAAQVTVQDIPGKPGAYKCVVHLKPRFQLDQMTSSVRLVTELVAGQAG